MQSQRLPLPLSRRVSRPTPRVHRTRLSVYRCIVRHVRRLRPYIKHLLMLVSLVRMVSDLYQGNRDGGCISS